MKGLMLKVKLIYFYVGPEPEPLLSNLLGMRLRHSTEWPTLLFVT